MELIDGLERVFTNISKLNVIFNHVECEVQDIEEVINFIIRSARIRLVCFVLAESCLNVERYPILVVCVPVLEDPEVLHCILIKTHSLREILGLYLVRLEVVLFELFDGAWHHGSPVDSFFSISPSPHFDLKLDVTIQLQNIQFREPLIKVVILKFKDLRGHVL